jgi:branched-chain amino acid transport system permease protein
MTALDPVVLAPLVVALMFVLGVSVYAGIIRYAMRAGANPGMVQIFATFGLALLIQGLAQYFFTTGLSQHCEHQAQGKTLNLAGVFLPWPQILGGVSLAVFAGLYWLITRADFGKAIEATREDQGAVALVGIDRNRVFALGWGSARRWLELPVRFWRSFTISTRRWAERLH